MSTQYVWEERNFHIHAVHPIYRGHSVPFKGTLPDVKKEAQKILDSQKEDGWKVTAMAEGRVIYCTYRKTEPVSVTPEV
jgi:hypothetical protein